EQLCCLGRVRNRDPELGHTAGITTGTVFSDGSIITGSEHTALLWSPTGDLLRSLSPKELGPVDTLWRYLGINKAHRLLSRGDKLQEQMGHVQALLRLPDDRVAAIFGHQCIIINASGEIEGTFPPPGGGAIVSATTFPDGHILLAIYNRPHLDMAI